jgi:adenylate kinase family enzyme
MSKRILIIGNSGAGKSFLAGGLADLLKLPAVDLDGLHWEDDRYGRKRAEAEARELAEAAATPPDWIIEGVYGWLAEAVIPRTTDLVWLDLPWAVCRAGLLARKAGRGQSTSDSLQLLDWAVAYWERQMPSSFAGHARIFEGFTGAKFRPQSRGEVDALVDRLCGNKV